MRALLPPAARCPALGSLRVRRGALRSAVPRRSTPCSAAHAAHAVAGEAPQHTLVLYTTPGCSLCAGLEEKLRAVLAAAAFRADSALRGAALELRQVDPAAPEALSVPLLARRGADGAETPLQRPMPRVTAAKLAAQLEAALAPLGGGDDAAAPSAAAAAAPWEAVQGVAWQPRTGP